MKIVKVVISGGGTGGHIYPAVSIAKEIKDRHPDAEIIFVGTERGLESKIVPKEGFELKKIKVRGLERKMSFSNVVALKEAVVSFFDVSGFLRDFKPDFVIGTGGYVCGSVLAAAAMMNIPTLIHEQNAFPGVTNKILSRMVDRVALNFAEAEKYFHNSKKVLVTGNPIRKDIMAVDREQGLREFGYSGSLPLVFVVGGSRGAKRINESILPLAKYCAEGKSFQLLHMTGETQYDDTLENYKKNGINIDDKFLKVVPYLYNLPYAMAACDIVISRCGAGLLSEITALGKPSVLIPFPYATDNHQEYNARALEQNGAAVVILERDLNDNILYDEVKNMLNNEERRRQMGERSRQLGRTDAAARIVNAVEELLYSKKRKSRLPS